MSQVIKQWASSSGLASLSGKKHAGIKTPLLVISMFKKKKKSSQVKMYRISRGVAALVIHAC